MNEIIRHCALPTALLLLLALPAAAQQAAGTTPATRTSAARVAQSADFIVAVVNTEPVTNHEVRARAARLARDDASAGITPPAQGELRKQALERLISERAQLQFAREQGIKVGDSELAQAELSVARQNNLASVDELHRRIEQEGITLADFRADLRNQVLLAQLRAREIEPSLRVSEAEVENYIRARTGAPTSVTQVNLGMILVAVPERATEAQIASLQERAQDVARRAQAGEDFAELAARYSDAPRAGSDGGAMGLRPVAEYPELFAQQTRSARVGEVVGPVRSGAGFHILKVLDRQTRQELAEMRIPQTHARHILLKISATQDQQLALKRAADLKNRIESGKATFEELAREYSNDASAAQGGDLGWAPPGQYVPEFEQAMNNLDPGRISDPVVTRYGVHLIEVLGREEQVLGPNEQRQLARNMLREQKAQEAFETWAREVRGRAYVEYREPPQ